MKFIATMCGYPDLAAAVSKCRMGEDWLEWARIYPEIMIPDLLMSGVIESRV